MTDMRRLSLIASWYATVHLWLGPLGAQAPTVTQIAGSTHILVRRPTARCRRWCEIHVGQLGRPKSTRTFEPAARVALPGKVVQVVAGDAGTSGRAARGRHRVGVGGGVQ